MASDFVGLLADYEVGVLAAMTVEAMKVGLATTASHPSDQKKSGVTRAKVERVRSWLISELDTEFILEHSKESDAELKSYLLSPELVTLLEHLFAFEVSNSTEANRTVLLTELHAGLRHHRVSVDGNASPERLFTGLWNIARLAVDDLDGAPRQIEPPQQLRISAQMSAISEQLSRLAAESAPVTPEEVHDFVLAYNRSALPSFIKIQPPNLDGAQPVPIRNIYVNPRFTTAGESCNLDWLARQHRVVILGDPGGGKTTLTTKLTNALLTNNDDYKPTRAGGLLVPVVVTLRDFAASFKSSPLSVIDYISEQIRSTYQVTTRRQVVDWMAQTGRFLFIFDGLDELTDPSLRKTIVSIIEAFSATYFSNRMLVTSRRVGYNLAPIASDNFAVGELASFSDEDTQDYVNKWFTLALDAGGERPLGIVERFLADSELVNDLRTNPLMLGLMCTIYRSEGYIPRNRPDVLEKCARLLFDRWDRRRNLFEELDFEAHIDATLASVASWIYAEESRQSGVEERHLVRVSADYLQLRRYTDRDLAEHHARQFVAFCKGRGWVFTDVGTTADGEPLYTFTHRTFLEYFTAYHLCRNHNLDELLGGLAPKITEGEWDVVAQLAIQIKTRDVEDGPTRALRMLGALLDASETNTSRLNVASFLARTLAFLIPFPADLEKVVHQVVGEYLHQVGTEPIYDGLNERDPSTARAWESIFLPLLHATRENVPTIATTTYATLGEEWRKNGPAAEFAASADWSISADRDYQVLTIPIEQHRSHRSELLNVLVSRLHDWKWATPAVHFEGAITLPILQQSSPDAFFAESVLPGTNSGYTAPAEFIAKQLIELRCQSGSIQLRQWVELEQETLINFIMADRAGWAQTSRPPSFFGVAQRHHELVDDETHQPFTDRQIAVFVAMFAKWTEFAEKGASQSPDAHLDSVKRLLSRPSLGHLEPVRPIFAKRYLDKNSASIFDLRHTSALHAAIRAWGDRQVSFLDNVYEQLGYSDG